YTVFCPASYTLPPIDLRLEDVAALSTDSCEVGKCRCKKAKPGWRSEKSGGWESWVGSLPLERSSISPLPNPAARQINRCQRERQQSKTLPRWKRWPAKNKSASSSTCGPLPRSLRDKANSCTKLANCWPRELQTRAAPQSGSSHPAIACPLVSSRTVTLESVVPGDSAPKTNGNCTHNAKSTIPSKKLRARTVLAL